MKYLLVFGMLLACAFSFVCCISIIFSLPGKASGQKTVDRLIHGSCQAGLYGVWGVPILTFLAMTALALGWVTAAWALAGAAIAWGPIVILLRFVLPSILWKESD